jgi:hypothetical protein
MAFQLARASWPANIPISNSAGISRGFNHANRDELPTASCKE